MPDDLVQRLQRDGALDDDIYVAAVDLRYLTRAADRIEALEARNRALEEALRHSVYCARRECDICDKLLEALDA